MGSATDPVSLFWSLRSLSLSKRLSVVFPSNSLSLNTSSGNSTSLLSCPVTSCSSASILANNSAACTASSAALTNCGSFNALSCSFFAASVNGSLHFRQNPPAFLVPHFGQTTPLLLIPHSGHSSSPRGMSAPQNVHQSTSECPQDGHHSQLFFTGCPQCGHPMSSEDARISFT